MTISTNADVIAGNDLTAQPEKILHTDDIAGTARRNPKNDRAEAPRWRRCR